MIDNDDATEEISLESEIALEAILRRPSAIMPERAPAPDDDSLVRYLSGAMPYEEARQVERALIADHDGRKRMMAVQKTLKAYRAAKWPEVCRLSEQGDTIAAAWTKVASSQVNSMGGSGDTLRRKPWPEIQSVMESGQVGVQSAWAAFLAFSDQWKLMRRLAGMQPALVKGSEPSGVLLEGDYPSDARVAFTARITEEGDLVATLAPSLTEQSAGSTLPPVRAELALRVRGESWPIAASELVEGTAEWRVPAFDQTLQLGAGPVSSECFAVRLGSLPAASSARQFILFAAPPTPEATELPAAPIEIAVISAPEWLAGNLSMILALPESTVVRYSRYLLAIDVCAGVHRWQQIGVWPVSDWSERPHRITASCPGDPSIPFQAPIRIVLLAPNAA